ncbi:SDR family oxidoreductase [soil metagenome]
MTAVVTGAASGIGFATADRFLDEGRTVVATDVRPDGLTALAERGAEIVVADLSLPEGRARVIEAATGATALVNCAGVLLSKDILDVTVDDWRRLFAVNVESVFFLSQQLAPTMPQGGTIVNLSSSSAKLASTTEVAVYAATKTTILSITRSFALRFAPNGIRVNAICPGVIDTPMQDQVLAEVAPARGLSTQEFAAARNRSIPLGRAGTAGETAALISFLCSDESAYMTGQAINITGGLVTW